MKEKITTFSILGTPYRYIEVFEPDSLYCSHENVTCAPWKKELIVSVHEYINTGVLAPEYITKMNTLGRLAIIKAFVFESGLHSPEHWSSIDAITMWMALQFEKMMNTFEILGYLDGTENNRSKDCVVEVLGTPYTVKEISKFEDPTLARNDGYCDPTMKTCIVVDIDEPTGYPDVLESLISHRKTVGRHELIHAYLSESGLSEPIWAPNEEMVNWLTDHFEKMIKVFNDLEMFEHRQPAQAKVKPVRKRKEKSA